MNTLRSTHEVAEEIGVRESQIHDALRRGYVTGVAKVGHARVWDAAAIERLRAALAARRGAESPGEVRRDPGNPGQGAV